MVIMSLSTKHKSWADVAVFEDENAGKLVETFLRDKGLEARTNDDKVFRAFLFLRPPRATFRVQVRDDKLESANELLGASASNTLQMAIRCPSCGSLRVSYPQMTRKFILPTIVLHLAIIFRVIPHECYCEACHFIWHLPGEKVYAPPKAAAHVHP